MFRKIKYTSGINHFIQTVKMCAEDNHHWMFHVASPSKPRRFKQSGLPWWSAHFTFRKIARSVQTQSRCLPGVWQEMQTWTPSLKGYCSTTPHRAKPQPYVSELNCPGFDEDFIVWEDVKASIDFSDEVVINQSHGLLQRKIRDRSLMVILISPYGQHLLGRVKDGQKSMVSDFSNLHLQVDNHL